VANLYQDKGKLHHENHLRLHKVMNSLYIFELLYQIIEFVGLRVARKHGLINKAKGVTAQVNERSSLRSMILELDNTSTSRLVCLEINISFSGKSRETINP
jgi:hypothetical protein